MLVHPYLDFDGRCEEALEFYRRAVGAEVTAVMRFKDLPEPPPPDRVAPGSENKVMHCEFRIGRSVLMATDGGCGGTPGFHGVTLALVATDAAEAEERFAALSDGGTVTMPLGPTFWSAAFGMVTDRFGISWMVNVAQ